MKKIQVLIIILSTLFTNASFANPNYVVNIKPTYDKSSNLITPDRVLLTQAVKAYQDGFNESAMTKFKQAAAFGNTQAERFIGLMYLKSLGVQQDWAKGYAWIKLAALDKSKKHTELQASVFSQLKDDEKARAVLEYQKISAEYDQSHALKRRERWVKKQARSSTGSRVGSQTANVKSYGSLRELNNGAGARANSGAKSLSAIENFVKNYNFGIVTAGEIKKVKPK